MQQRTHSLQACNDRFVSSTGTADSVSRLRRSLAGWALVALGLAVLSAPSPAQDVTTHHNDNTRSGVQTKETVLTPANVSSTSFGKLFSLAVIGDVYAQPLYLQQITMGDGKLHNVVFVATQQDYVYAFDADGNNPAQGYLWRVSLLGAGETWVLGTDVGTTDIQPNIGITGTPVIDRAGAALYVLAKSKTTSGTVQYVQRLHALNLADGAEKLSGPTTIAATMPGTSATFDPFRQNQRPALLLAPTPGGPSANSVLIAWASHGDNAPYHGWVISYNAANISQQTGAWADTPTGVQGGIWMSAGGISTDGVGNFFAVSGNGTFDANTGGQNYSESAFRLTLTTKLALADYFTPANQQSLNDVDNDMGVGAVALLPNQTGVFPHLLVTADKSGTIYLVNRDNMGHFGSANNTSVQSFSDGGYAIHNSFAFFNNTIYLAADNAPLQAWTFNPSSELFATTAQSRSSINFGTGQGDGAGSTPSISANGTSNGLVWAIDNHTFENTAAVLHVYDATNLANERYNSAQAAGNRDAAAIAVKFTTPTIANGHVYVGGRNAVTVYGLLSQSQAAATPAFSPAPGTYTSTQNVTISDPTSGASIFYTTNGANPTTASTPYTGPIQVAATETLKAIATASGFSQSAVATATYTIGSGVQPAATPTFSPAGGTYSATQTVTISDVTSGASIFYTTNGTTPTTSSTSYTGPIQVAASETIQAIATASGSSQSAVGSAAYTISTGVAGGQGVVSYGSGFTGGTLKLNGSARLNGARLQLTSASGQAGTGYSPAPVNVQSFTNDFTFQITQPSGDGMTFVIQNAGPTAVGGGGGSLGYSGMNKSVAIKFDLYNNAGEGIDSTGIYTNGASPTLPAIDLTPSGVNLHSLDQIKAHMVYDGATLTVTLTDLTTHATATQTYTVNIPSVVGASTAYVGFTGGTGGASAIQEIVNWVYAPTPYFPSSVPVGSLSLNGNAAYAISRLRLTDGGATERSSAYFPTTINVQNFTTMFSFQLANPGADGFTFVVQNAGSTALGSSGVGLGYGADTGLGTAGIPASVAVKFDLYSNGGEGPNSTGLFTGGAQPTVPSTDLTGAGIDLHSGHVFVATMSYSGTTLTVVITDQTTGAKATQTYTVDIPSVVGGPYAYVGFTGGTGGISATQEVLTWMYQ